MERVLRLVERWTPESLDHLYQLLEGGQVGEEEMELALTQELFPRHERGSFELTASGILIPYYVSYGAAVERYLSGSHGTQYMGEDLLREVVVAWANPSLYGICRSCFPRLQDIQAYYMATGGQTFIPYNGFRPREIPLQVGLDDYLFRDRSLSYFRNLRYVLQCARSTPSVQAEAYARLVGMDPFSRQALGVSIKRGQIEGSRWHEEVFAPFRDLLEPFPGGAFSLE